MMNDVKRAIIMVKFLVTLNSRELRHVQNAAHRHIPLTTSEGVTAQLGQNCVKVTVIFREPLHHICILKT